jgi:hypothetical protein
LPDSRKIVGKFAPSDNVDSLLKYVKAAAAFQIYAVSLFIIPRTFTDKVRNTATLLELGLGKGGTVHVKKT